MTPRIRPTGTTVAILLLLPLGVRAADDQTIQSALSRGVAFLKKQQDGKGTWTYVESTPGATALAGLTLLECDMPPTDRAVQRAAEAVRPATVTLTHTYSLALAVLFLDHLGDPADVPLIQSMGVRLLAGQKASGGWTYDCPPNSREESRRLNALITKRRSSAGGREPAGQADRDDRPVLAKELQQQLKTINPQAGPQHTDNSNTKFATLALWVARRYGVPAETALGRVESRFRGTQNADGGWGYLPGGKGALGQSLGSMTCAGLLGLAFGHGSAAESSLRTGARPAEGRPAPPPDMSQDRSIRQGLLLLAGILSKPLDPLGREAVPLFNLKGDEYYFLWALERVAVAYGLETIGNKDWYAWGAQYLLARQRTDGSWHGRYAPSVDTCFALLFLRRANLSKDLTATLKGRVGDPGQVTLKSGEVGGRRPEQPREGPGQGNEDRGQKTEDRGQKTEDKGQKTEDKGQKTEGGNLEGEIARLTAALLQAPEERQEQLLTQYKAARGVAYTQALAGVIPKLPDASRKKARDALAERLARMTAQTLNGRLNDDDPEIRRATALACAMRDERSHIPNLIARLQDSEPLVARAAHAALKSLSGKDFGPAPGASPAEQGRAVRAWKDWWDQQPGTRR